MQIKTDTHADDRWLILIVSGTIDAETAPQLQSAAEQHLAEGRSHLAIDLGDVNYVSSAGLRVLLLLLRAITKQSGQMSLINPHPNVREVLDISGLSQLFKLVADRSQLG